MDKGSELDFVDSIHARYGVGPLEHTNLGEYDSDWDTIYPISSFLETYRFPLTPTPHDWPRMKYTSDVSASDGVRRVKLSMDFVSGESGTSAHVRLG